MKVIFSERAFAGVMAETAEKISTETGGLFLGIVDGDTWYIIETIDPGPKSVFQVAYFEYDRQYTQHLINKVANLYDAKLSLIGLWHRHPGSFDIFSDTDDGTNTKYAGMRPEGAISALVNIDPKFRITMYHVARPCRYTKVSYEVGDDRIPDRYRKLKSPNRFERIMWSILYPQNSDREFQVSISLKSFMDTLEPRFADRKKEEIIESPVLEEEKTRQRIIDCLLDDLMFMSDELGIKMSVLQKNKHVSFVQDSIDGLVKVTFLYSEDADKVFFHYDGKTYLYEGGLFQNLYYMMEEDEDGSIQTQPQVDSQEKAKKSGKRKIINDVFNFMKNDSDGGK